MFMSIKTLAYNKRQIVIMEEKIALYYQGKIFLLQLFNDLFNMMQCLKEVSGEWKWEVICYINRIDSIYAFADSENRNCTDDDQKKIDEYVGIIQSMLNDYKKEHKLDEFDEEYEEYKLLYPENNNDDDIKQ